MLSLATEASELLLQRRYTESRAAFLRLANLPLFADQGYMGLGMIALRIGDPHAARWHFLHALRCNPGYAPAHAALWELDRDQPRAGSTRPGGAAGASLGTGNALGGRPRRPADREPRPAHAAPDREPDARSRAGGAAVAPGVGDLGGYEYLRTDTSLLGQHVTAALAALPGRQHGRALAHAGRLTALAGVLSALIVVAIGSGRLLEVDLPDQSLWAVGGLIWCGAVLRVRTTVHDLTGGRLTIRRGLLLRRVTQLELSRVRSIERRRTLLDRITGHGELRFTADAPDRQVLRARGLARGSRLRTLHGNLSDLVFLLRSSPPGPGPTDLEKIDWPLNNTAAPAVGRTSRASTPLRRIDPGQRAVPAR